MVSGVTLNDVRFSRCLTRRKEVEGEGAVVISDALIFVTSDERWTDRGWSWRTEQDFTEMDKNPTVYRWIFKKVD